MSIRNVEDDLPKLTVDLDIKKSFAITICLVLFLITPILVLENVQKNLSSPSSGRVAGISTAQITESLNSQGGLLVILGALLVGIAAILLTYLYLDNRRFKKTKSAKRKSHTKN